MYCNTFENLSAKFTTRSDLLYLDPAEDRDSYNCVIGEVRGWHSPDDINDTLDSIGSQDFPWTDPNRHPSKLSATLEPGAPMKVTNTQPVSSPTQTANDTCCRHILRTLYSTVQESVLECRCRVPEWPAVKSWHFPWKKGQRAAYLQGFP